MPYKKLEISTESPVLSWANHELKDNETQMAKNVASLPFVFKHVALMPDVHLGKGALVGSVIATKEAIIPAAVGVDIGCFVGDTLIPLVDGKSYSLKELASKNKEFVVYACTSTGKIVAAKATAKLTRKNAALVKVILDNGEEIICTPDHQFMMRDGSYKEAQHLQPETSLMPFYSKLDKDGYTLISQPYSGRWQKAQTDFMKSSNDDFATVAKDLQSEDILVPYNHKVVAVIPVEYKEDVYCLTVPEYHNFALKAGVFVHNCGMGAIKTPFKGEKLEGKLKKIRLDIEAAIPTGFNENKDLEKAVTNWQNWRDFKDLHSGVQDLENKAMKQLGSLGGGNHFIEVCVDTENQVWLMLHSGSRNIGNKLAQYHISTAKDLAKMADANLPDKDLAHFVTGTPEFAAYWRDLQWAQEYARFNRDVMMARFKKIIEKHLAGGKPFKPLLVVNCHHNYSEKEVHFGEDVYVTRKGAVRAQKEDYGIIPGSMGAKSYIVKGKGNVESFCSCFTAGTKVLTEFGLMNIEDVFNSSKPIKLISYNEQLQKFEAKSILDQSERISSANKYSVSQTRRRLENTITCTSNHPFATYKKGILSYSQVEDIVSSSKGVIVPTNINIRSGLTAEEQDRDFYYLLGVILSDGTIHLKQRKNAPEINNRPRKGKYLHSYIRIYQSQAAEKRPFINYLQELLKSYSDNVSVRIQQSRTSRIKGRLITGLGLVELTLHDLAFVSKIQQTLPLLPNILMGNPFLALYFLAGYLDGDGTHNKGTVSISVGKTEMFSAIVCSLLSLGVAYKVYRNRKNYVVEFRDNILLQKLSSICRRLKIDEPPSRLYSDKLLLTSDLAGGSLKCDNLTTMARCGKMVSISKFAGQSIDQTLAMNRIFKVESDLKLPVYNFTVEDNHNYIVFTEYYTPLLVHNCSHGAGRLMSRTKAKKAYTLDDLIEQTKGVECRKDEGILDEIPGAYKPIEQVMENQSDLVEVVATLKQVLCVKG
ncbi:MAG: RtcB family protein [Rivularia sp. (in: Bacteria)]|nr:RtcB family protein [Rivularia sp. MS3]